MPGQPGNERRKSNNLSLLTKKKDKVLLINIGERAAPKIQH
ncbi:hypothetical protein C900_04509 [Fulvivirga imtechensis AK7]|uniref:Uncharacterized protein n=1 Tax=Fulvivirga imtechensis AK7 TaxID=1237149 RepID=L8JM69_9BACT|nr:hypothetical protein C900_04509 [Fulvivirga imtechensis AK7]